MLCNDCGFDNKHDVPFCDRCGAACFDRKRKRRSSRRFRGALLGELAGAATIDEPRSGAETIDEPASHPGATTVDEPAPHPGARTVDEPAPAFGRDDEAGHVPPPVGALEGGARHGDDTVFEPPPGGPPGEGRGRAVSTPPQAVGSGDDTILEPPPGDPGGRAGQGSTTIQAPAPRFERDHGKVASSSQQLHKSELSVDEDFLLAMLPLLDEPSPEQIQCYAEVFELEPYSARLRLNSTLPRILKVARQADLLGLARRLDDALIPFICVAAGAILDRLSWWEVTELELRGVHLTLGGPAGVVDLDLRDECFVTRGRYEQVSQTGGDRATPVRMRRLPGQENRRRTQRTALTDFLHVYHPSHPVPYRLTESSLRDYGFLGEAMTASASTNFRLLTDHIRSCPGTVFDETLWQHHHLVAETLTEAGSLVESYLDSRGDRTNNRRSTDTLSRILYYSWY